MTVIVPLQPPNLGILPTDLHQQDPNTPRAVLSSSIVAAAVASLPTLSPVLPALSHEPDYCLAAKRKATGDDELDPPRATKKAKSDSDALFGPLTTHATPAPPIGALPPQQDASLDITIEQAPTTAALYGLPQDDHHAPAATTEGPSPPPSHQEAVSSRVQSPLASSTLLDVLSDNDGSQWKASSVQDVSAFFEAMSQPVAGPSTVASPQMQSSELLSTLGEEKPASRPPRIRPPPMLRNIEPPLWKLACRARVDHVIQHYGSSTVRATLAHEAAARRFAHGGKALGGFSSRRSLLESCFTRSKSELHVEIYTPSSFTSGASSPVDSDLDATDSEIEEDADMSFDLDDDWSDSDADEEEDTECDSTAIVVDEHESIMDVTLDPATRGDAPSRVLAPGLAPSPPPPPEMTSAHFLPITISISADLPPLPRLSSIPLGFLREYPEVVSLGTPSRAHPHACGMLSRAGLRAQAQLEREVYSRAVM